MAQNKKIFIIAGEASGDILGAKLMSALKSEMPHIEFHGIGGTQMKAQGIKSIIPIEGLSLMGFVEVIPHIFKLRKYMAHAVKRIMEYEPDLVITIDSPGFNFRIVEKLKKNGLEAKFIHMVAPSVWAYNPGRAKVVARLYDLLLTLLPFEPPLFTKHGMKAEFIGHPIFEQNFNRSSDKFRNKYSIPKDAEVICVTPGSRRGEIERHMRIFAKSLALLQTKYKIFVLFPLCKESDKALVESNVGNAFPHACILDDEKLDAYEAADVALAKSGTNVLEILACDTPVVVTYRLNPLTYYFIKLKAMIKYISIINIIANKEIIPEYIQNDCNPVKLANAIAKFIENDRLADIEVKESQKIMASIGFRSKTKASTRAAKMIVKECINI